MGRKVKPEQASRPPGHLGKAARVGKQSTCAPTRSAGVVDTARRKGGSQLQVETRRGRESDGAIGALMLGNAGGAKGPTSGALLKMVR
jgi:hypothetical protein